MIDFGVRAATEESLFAGLEALGVFVYDASGFELRETGAIEGGGLWWVHVIGEIIEPSTSAMDDPDPAPPVVREGQHVNMRWNGAPEHMPDLPPELEMIWRSDDEELTRPDWWSQVMA